MQGDDLVYMVAWKDGETEIKTSFKREFTKGMQDTPKKPKHPLYGRLKPAPPLSANGLLFLLAIIISAGAFRDYSTSEDILAARPPPGRKYRIMDWVDGVLNDPVFPEMSADGPTEKTRKETAWDHQYGGYSLGQVMKFAAHRNSKTLISHYLDDMSIVDGAAVFLGLEPRRDLTKDFRYMSMRRNPDLQHSLPGKCLDELRWRRGFTDLGEQIDNLSAQITAAITEKGRQELKAQRHYVYDQRQKLINEELGKYRRAQRRVHTTQREVDDLGEWHRSYFDRVVRHMVPERDRRPAAESRRYLRPPKPYCVPHK
ncbi:hypothetical protein HD806DRAFT_534041 [Xylariaceae sp. AK1471]|nr:hypothetical protein HD806DRAFT_534041 [Xylariaceae sp. AK1471]